MRKVSFLLVMLLPDKLRECSINVAFFKWPVVYLLCEHEPLCLFPPSGWELYCSISNDMRSCLQTWTTFLCKGNGCFEWLFYKPMSWTNLKYHVLWY